MRAVREWSTRHARMFEWCYQHFEKFFLKFSRVCARIGFERLDPPVAFFERVVKGLMFDCQMCGQCTLSSTGMTCPMNCPKQLRNGPCGGVRPDGTCELDPKMRCVWAVAWSGSGRMRKSDKILQRQKPLDWRRQGTSSWLAVMIRKSNSEKREGDQQ